jgi:hypothetical protein
MSPVCVCTSIMLRRGYKRASVATRWIISRNSQMGNGRRLGEAGGPGRAGKLGSQVSSPRVAFPSFQTVNLHTLQHFKICRKSSRIV